MTRIRYIVAERITATAKAAFGWFVKEVFHAQVNLTDLKESEEKSLSLSVDSRFPEILRNGEEMVLRAWNKGALFVDEQNRIRVQDDNGFAEDGEVCRIVSYTDTHGHQHMFGDADFDGRRNGTYETITGSRYRSLPPICPVLVKDGIRSAKDAAAKADTVIYVGGAHPMITCKEEVDRKDIAFPHTAYAGAGALSGKSPSDRGTGNECTLCDRLGKAKHTGYSGHSRRKHGTG